MEDRETRRKPKPKEIPLDVNDYLFRRNDVPATLKAAFKAYANDPRSGYGPNAVRKRAEWAEALETFRFQPVSF